LLACLLASGRGVWWWWSIDWVASFCMQGRLSDSADNSSRFANAPTPLPPKQPDTGRSAAHRPGGRVELALPQEREGLRRGAAALVRRALHNHHLPVPVHRLLPDPGGPRHAAPRRHLHGGLLRLRRREPHHPQAPRAPAGEGYRVARRELRARWCVALCGAAWRSVEGVEVCMFCHTYTRCTQSDRQALAHPQPPWSNRPHNNPPTADNTNPQPTKQGGASRTCSPCRASPCPS
jgi:hypothetical protein